MFRKNSLFTFSALLIGCLFLGSCKDIIEKDISEETPTLILPAVYDTVEVNPVHVKWEALSGATKYKVEIVSPSFANIQEFAVDSIVTGTDFYIDLDSNQYQVRLTALNAGYQSITSDPRTFWVGTSVGSSSGTVQLDSPSNGLYVNESFNGLFSWYGLSGVSSYTFELHEGVNFSGTTLHYADQLATSSISSYDGTELDEGTYCWGVKAFLTNGDETTYSKRTIYVDTVNPSIATPNLPLNNASVNAGQINFTWQVPGDVGTVQSPLISILQISTNTSFTAMLTPESVSGNTTNYNLAAGTYYWRIRMQDEAGNLGPAPSTYRTLTVFP